MVVRTPLHLRVSLPLAPCFPLPVWPFCLALWLGHSLLRVTSASCVPPCLFATWLLLPSPNPLSGLGLEGAFGSCTGKEAPFPSPQLSVACVCVCRLAGLRGLLGAYRGGGDGVGQGPPTHSASRWSNLALIGFSPANQRENQPGCGGCGAGPGEGEGSWVVGHPGSSPGGPPPPSIRSI